MRSGASDGIDLRGVIKALSAEETDRIVDKAVETLTACLWSEFVGPPKGAVYGLSGNLRGACGGTTVDRGSEPDRLNTEFVCNGRVIGFG